MAAHGISKKSEGWFHSGGKLVSTHTSPFMSRRVKISFFKCSFILQVWEGSLLGECIFIYDFVVVVTSVFQIRNFTCNAYHRDVGLQKRPRIAVCWDTIIAKKSWLVFLFYLHYPESWRGAQLSGCSFRNFHLVELYDWIFNTSFSNVCNSDRRYSHNTGLQKMQWRFVLDLDLFSYTIN